MLPLDDRGEEYLARPPGYTYHNRHGMRFRVFRYAEHGFRHCPARPESGRELDLYHGDRPPTFVLPAVVHLNPSDRLRELYREVTASTPKQLVLFDAAGLSERSRQVMEGICFVSWREHPDMMSIIVDSNVCREDVIADELMHIWLDLVEGYEDHRRYRDATNGRNSFTVLSVQSFVIDCKVQEKLKERGFPLREFTDDIVQPLFDCARAVEAGIDLANRSQEAVMANLLARTGAVPQLYDLVTEDWEKMRYARRVFERHVPDLVRLADGVAEAFERHGYSRRPEALKLIDECLRLHFTYLGEPLDFQRDFHIEHDAVERCEEFLPASPGVPRGLAPNTLRRLARGGHFGRAQIVSGLGSVAPPQAPSVAPLGQAARRAALLHRNRRGVADGGPPFGNAEPHSRGPITHGPDGLPLRDAPGVPPLPECMGPAFHRVGPLAGYRPPVPWRRGISPVNGGSGPPPAPGGRPRTGGPPPWGRHERP
ncbi:MAG: hypothetical protein ACYTKD_11905 [Planctomycetota bacterium]